jgi:hypothetical protein
MSRDWLARLGCRLAGVIGASSLMVVVAQAATFTQNGPIASLSGPITAGDDLRLNAFLHRPEAAQIRLLYLNSPGGMVYEAYKMSETVRASNLSTAVDASHAYCASACTALFVAGVRRYYLNAQTIVDGDPRQKRGLGFHEASDWGGGRFAITRRSSFEGNNIMAYVYREMGVPGASNLTERASYTGIYWVSGPTALSLSIATSLSKP